MECFLTAFFKNVEFFTAIISICLFHVKNKYYYRIKNVLFIRKYL